MIGGRPVLVMRAIAAAALLTGLAMFVAPVQADVEPLPLPGPSGLAAAAPAARAHADSLAEDIILFNLFAPSRSAPTRRFSPNAPASGPVDAPVPMDAGFSPVLMGTAVSDRPGETRALLQLIASDPTPRLYAVGDRAGGFSVVSIDARSVVLSGPRGRVVLRLPENEENHS